MTRDCCVALPPSDMGLSAVCDSGISWSYSLTISECIGQQWRGIMIYASIYPLQQHMYPLIFSYQQYLVIID